MKKEKLIGVMLLFWVINMKPTIGRGPIAKPGCVDICGNVTIPYPFGIGSNCSANQTFTITCDDTSSSKPFLTSLNLVVIDIRLETSTIHLSSPVTTSADLSSTTPHPNLNLSETPFSFNSLYNVFTGIGCQSKPQLFDASTTTNNQGTGIVACFSMCRNDTRIYGSPCYGTKCCQTVSFSTTAVHFAANNASSRSISSTSGCNYSYIMEEEWFSNFGDRDLTVEGRERVALVLDWKTDEKCYLCDMLDDQLGCTDQKHCSCAAVGTKGNAYLPNGCQDINECEDSTKCYGNMVCIKDREGSYCRIPPKSKTIMLSIGIGSGLGGLFLVTGAWWLRKIIKRRKKAKLKKKFFKRNGGLLLQQQYLTSAEQGYVEKTKLFTSKELDRATDGYNENRILGHGSQGTVYKGMLTDGKIVAIKKSKIVDEGKLNEFINEVVILSQINHRNVVKLHGCCLETQVPMLVYDFIPNGSLFHYIHHQQNEDFPLLWDVRLRIASEVAEALSYLHSAASQPIYHRDVKSSNILLDDKYRAKVADFGTSRSMDIDETHMTTRVHGTFGYLDPEYFQSSKYTAKSDVYSFGVVLLELLTGQKAVLPITFEDGRSLATYFMFSMKENRLFDILDAQVRESGGKKEINEVANLARRCLNLNGKKRPTMKEVAMKLEAIRIPSRASPPSQECYDHSIIELAHPWDTSSSSMTSSIHGR